MDCTICGKPLMHGVMGYSKPMCVCMRMNWVPRDQNQPTMIVTEALVRQSAEIARLRADLTASQAECERLRDDAERIDFLDLLCGRKDESIENEKLNQCASDMYLKDRVYLFVRNAKGHVVFSGYGTVRESIDSVRSLFVK